VEQRFCEICGAKQTREKAFGGHVCSSEHFKDVDLDLWYHEDLDYVVENGLMIGISDDEFGPNLQMTRAMVVTALYRLEGEPAPKSKDRPFGDVASGSWYDAAVSWAAENGIVNGTSATTFAPTDPITREQFAAILYRYADHKKYDVSQKADLNKYTDADSISGYAQDAFGWANAAGLDGISSPSVKSGHKAHPVLPRV
jgi:hypothetical protein